MRDIRGLVYNKPIMELWVGEVVATRMMNGVYVYMFVYSDLLTGAQLTVTGVHKSECTFVMPF